MKKIQPFLILLGLIVYVACTKQNHANPVLPISNIVASSNENASNVKAAGYKTFIIKKGAHYSSPNPLVFTSKTQLKFNAIFDSSCIYSTIDPQNQADINKLYGFSDCGTHHLVNSARIGWRWFNNQLELRTFTHIGGVIQPDYLLAVLPIGAVANCRISCLATSYEFEVNGNVIQVPRGCTGNYSKYKLNPYFGGDETSPINVKILIQELK